jgi:multiple sugar transport system permease protein
VIGATRELAVGAPGPAPPASRRRSGPRLRQEARWAALFLAPDLLGVLAFTAFPVFAAIVLSFLDWNLITAARYAGLDNFQELLKDEVFWRTMAHTVYFTVGTVPTSMALGLVLALALNRPLRGVTFLRTAYFIPVIVPLISVAMVWRWLYDRDFGLINYFLNLTGLPVIGWLTDRTWAMPAVILMSIWKGLGYNLVIYLAGLQSIPRRLYEAAEMDGATAWQRFWRITFPLLTPTTFFVLVVSIISSFQVFSQVYVMTRGGPGDATTTIVYYIYHVGFELFRMGYASALAWTLFIVVFVLTLVQVRTQRRWVYYE